MPWHSTLEIGTAQLLFLKKSRRNYRTVSGMDFVLANNNHHHHQQQQHHDDEDDGNDDHDHHDDDDDDRLTVFCCTFDGSQPCRYTRVFGEMVLTHLL